MRFSSAPTLLAAALAATFCGCSNSDSNSAAPVGAAAPPVPQVGFVTLHGQQVPFVATVPGRMIASGVSEIRPQVSGIIQKRLFREGGEVKSGDVLYQIDDLLYRAALDSAKAAAERAKATVANAQASSRARANSPVATSPRSSSSMSRAQRWLRRRPILPARMRRSRPRRSTSTIPA